MGSNCCVVKLSAKMCCDVPGSKVVCSLSNPMTGGYDAWLQYMSHTLQACMTQVNSTYYYSHWIFDWDTCQFNDVVQFYTTTFTHT